MVETHSVSYSEVSSYLQCKRKHFYGYIRGLQKTHENAALATGTAGHAVLEAYYRVILGDGEPNPQAQKNRQYEALLAAEDKYQEIMRGGYDDPHGKVPLGTMLFDWYFPNEPYVQTGWTILAVEQAFKLEVSAAPELGYNTNIVTPFVIDLIAYDPLGNMVVIDHKFMWDYITEKVADLSPQIPLYIAGLRASGYKDVSYGMYNMIRTRPKANSMVADRVKQLPLKPNNVRVQTTYQEQIDASNEIEDRKRLPIEVQRLKAHRVANKMVCQSCSFASLCSAELNGANTKMVEAMEYKKRDRRTFEQALEGPVEDE